MSSSIEEFVAQRGIKSLFHFTRLDNLRSILAHGLLIKSECALNGVEPVVNDQHRYDGTGAISTTIGFPNYKMLYRLRCDNPEVNWVVLELKSSLLWRTKCAFSDTNAGDGSVYNTAISQRQGLPALQSMFADYKHVKRATLNIPDRYTTNPQAEVLLLEGASIEDCKNIYFELRADLKTYMAEFPNLRGQIEGGYFDGRHDYAHWK